MDFTYPSGDGEPPWSNDPSERFAFDPNFDAFVDYTHRAIQTLNILDYSSLPMTPFLTIRANLHVFRTNKHVVINDTPDYENLRSYFGWVNADTVQKLLNRLHNGESPFPTLFLRKGTSSLGTQHLTSLEDMNQSPLTLFFLTPLQ